MKKLTKTLFAVAAVTVVSTAMTVSAMAATTHNITGTYENGVVTLNGVVSSGDSQTILILTDDTSVDSTNANDIVVAIDQNDVKDSIFENVKVKAFDASVEKLYVRIGGSDGELQTGEISVKDDGGVETGDTITVIIGDIDGNKSVTMGDATALARWNARYRGEEYKNDTVSTSYTVKDSTDNLVIGDIDGNKSVTMGDATALARWSARYRGEEYKNDTVNTKVEVYSPVTE